MMAEHELGGTLTEEQSRSITEFLKTLTGELPADYIREPELPPSTDATPKPDTSE
jgi:cytochrome c peroxidase